MSANVADQRHCALCGGLIQDDRCTVCGTLATASDDAPFAATAKRPAVPPEALLPPTPENLSMTQPTLPAIRIAQRADDLEDTRQRAALPRNRAVLLAPTEAKAVGEPQSVASQTGETKALIEKSIVGTQWIMVAILIGVPLGFLTQILMGRIGPDALGTYRLMIVLVTAVQTFFLFGGANVIVNFIPRATAKEKSALLLSYVGIAFVFSIVFFVVMLIFPQALDFLLLNKATASPTIYFFLLLFVPIVIGQTLTIAVLQGEMELGIAARTQYGVQTVSFAFALVAALVVVRYHLLPTSIVPVLVVLGAYIISFATGFMALRKVMRQRWQWSLRWYLPSNFWNFTLTFHFNTVVFFFFTSIDQLYITYVYSITQNGIYGAALVVATYALWAPNLFTGAMYPFFTNLVAKGDYTTLKGAYQRYSAITGVIVALVSLTAGLFAPEILRLFGKNYSEQSLPLMIVFSLMYTIFASAAYVPSTALITAHEDIWLNLILNIVSLAVRFGLYGPLVARFGLIGVAYANAISLGVLYISTLVAVGLRYRVSVPLRQHVVSLAGGVLLLAPYAWQPASHTLQLVERFVALLLFILIISQLRLISREDLATVMQRLNRIKFLQRFLPKTA